MTPRFLYVPWVRAHGDWLIEEVAGACAARFEPLRLFAPHDDPARRELLSLAALRPGAVEQAMRRRLRRLGGVAHGLALTHDWPAPLAAAARVANEIGLPTVLVWGELQAGVFRERGMAPDRVRLVGSPKLDRAARHVSLTTREALRAAIGADPARRIVLFAMQPMDNAADPARARRAQAAAILDLARLAREADATLIVRPPPAGRAALPGLDGLPGLGALIVPCPQRPAPVDLEAPATRAGGGVDRIALFRGLRPIGPSRRLAARLA